MKYKVGDKVEVKVGIEPSAKLIGNIKKIHATGKVYYIKPVKWLRPKKGPCDVIPVLVEEIIRKVR